MDAVVVGICENNLDAATIRSRNGVPQPLLIIPSEDFLIVFNKAVYIVCRRVWRIYEDKVAFFRLIDHGLEITAPKICAREQHASRFEVILGEDNLRLRAERDIEFTPQVLAVKTIKASAIQIEKLSSTEMRSGVVSRSFLVEEFFRMLRLKI